MKGNIAQMMQKAQRMQENMQKVQEELAHMEVTGQAGGGAVKITLSGKFEARKVSIDPAVLGDAEMLEDLLVAAMNDAVAIEALEAASFPSDEAASLTSITYRIQHAPEYFYKFQDTRHPLCFAQINYTVVVPLLVQLSDKLLQFGALP